MFDAYCPTCATRRLVFASQIRGIEQGDTTTVVAFECWCGELAAWSTARADRGAEATPARQAR